MIKNIILLCLLWALATPVFADSCADEGEGNTDWVSIGTGLGPNDNSGCGDPDSGYQHIFVEITPTPVCPIFQSCEYRPNYAFLNITQPDNQVIFSLAFDDLLNNLPAGNAVEFADLHAQLPTEIAKLMGLEVRKSLRSDRRVGFRVDVNWYQLGFSDSSFVSDSPNSIEIPQDYTGELRFWITLATRSSKLGSYTELSLEVVGDGIYAEFVHPRQFDVTTQPSSVGLGLISADQVPPVGDVIYIKNSINLFAPI